MSARLDSASPDPTRDRPATRPLGIIAVVVAILSFSTSSSIIKWSEATGSVVAFWRMIGAVAGWWLVVLIAKARTGRPLPTRETWVAVLPPALFFGLNISIFFTAITRTSIAHAEFIGTLSPLVLLPAGAIFFGEHPNWGALRFGLVSMVGVALVLFFGPAGGTSTVAGDLLMALVIVTWTSYLLTSKRARQRGVDTLDFMACMMPMGLLTAGPVAASIAGTELFSLSARAWLVVALLTVGTGMLAHGCIIFAQRHLPVATIGVMQTGQPALAVLSGFVILGESVRAPQVAGMVLVVVGLSLFTWSSQRPVATGPTSAALTVTAAPTGRTSGATAPTTDPPGR